MQRLGELCGALFIEFITSSDDTSAIETTRNLARDVNAFSERFETAFDMTPLEATRRFIDFISGTEGKPRERLKNSIYGIGE